MYLLTTKHKYLTVSKSFKTWKFLKIAVSPSKAILRYLFQNHLALNPVISKRRVIYLKKKLRMLKQRFTLQKQILYLLKKKKNVKAITYKRNSLLNRRINVFSKYHRQSFKFKWPTKAVVSDVIMRENRNILRFLFNWKFKRQGRLTKYLKFFLFTTTRSTLISYELSMFNVLLRSRLCFSTMHYKDLISSSSIFLNHFLFTKSTHFLKKNDLIQFNIVANYFPHQQYVFSNICKSERRISYIIWRYYRHRLNFYKQRPKKFPNWITRLMYHRVKIPNYLEVDFSILTICIIDIPQKVQQLNPYITSNFNYFLKRLYNWKYVN